MYRLLLLLVPAIVFAGQSRFARLGEMDGKVDIQLQAADPWLPAERNLPLTESAWLRTGVLRRPGQRRRIRYEGRSVPACSAAMYEAYQACQSSS